MSKRDKKKSEKSVQKQRTPAIECTRCGEWYSPGFAPAAKIHFNKRCKPKNT
jgi:hypothetical protein